MVAIFFLYKEVVQFYSISKRIWDSNNERIHNEKNTTRDFLTCKGAYSWGGGPCIENACERKFYELKVLKWPLEINSGDWRYVYDPDIICDFEKPGFEEILKRQGYNKLLDDPHYGKKFQRPKFGR